MMSIHIGDWVVVQVYGSHGPVQPAFVLIQVKTPFIASSNGHETDLARRRGYRESI